MSNSSLETETEMLTPKASRLRKMRDLKSKLKLDSHHTIERFGVMLGVLILVFVVIVTGGVVGSVQKHTNVMTDISVYTAKTRTSRTGLDVAVKGVYSDADHRRVMVLFEFDNVAQISTDAKDYQAFITGVDYGGPDAPVKYEKISRGAPAGAIYMFGNTGYMGVYLSNSMGFDKQIVSLIVRAKAELIAPTDATRREVSNDESFNKFDQFRVFVNPGASGATPSAALNKDTPDITELYNEMVIKPQEDELRLKLDEQLLKLKADRTAIEAARYKLFTYKTPDGDSVVEEADPAALAGDVVEGVPAGKDKSGAATPSTLTFKPKTVVANGFDFDWRSKTIKEGYLDSLVPKGTDYVDYLTKKKTTGTAPSMDATRNNWKMSNGRFLSDYGSNLQNVLDLTSGLNTSYTTYMSDKTTYQSKLLGDLLSLEMDYKDVQQNQRVNMSEKAVIVYEVKKK